MSDRQIPKFSDESAEASWWFERRKEISQDIISALRQGRLGEGSKARYARRVRALGNKTLVRADIIRTLTQLDSAFKTVEIKFYVPLVELSTSVTYDIRPTGRPVNFRVKGSRKRLLAGA
jgi:hypothetical protein